MRKPSLAKFVPSLTQKQHEMYTFLKFLVKNVIEDDCSYVASALTFTTLLAIVPLMSVSFAVLSSFPVFQELALPVQNYIFEHFVPATGKVVQQYLVEFTQQVTKLSLWGIVFLFITSVLVMVTIERSLNKIWKVRTQRQGVAAFLLYWAILSLAPLMIGLSIAASSYLISLPFLSKESALNVSLLFRYAPFALSFSCFFLLYLIVPNCRVKVAHAATGALTAALLLEIAKAGFGWYTSSYDTYALLYGAFATVPIFFLWVYWAWFIVLLGAEVAYALSAPHQRRTGPTIDGFTHAVTWLYQLWQAQLNGQSLSLEQLIKADHHAYQVSPDTMLETLINQRLVAYIEGNRYILSRDLSQMSINELRELLPWRIPSTTTVQLHAPTQRYLNYLDEAEKITAPQFSQKVIELF